MPRIVKEANAEKLMRLPRPMWENKGVRCGGCDCEFEVTRGDHIQPAIQEGFEGFFTFCAGCGHPLFVAVRELPKIVAASSIPNDAKKLLVSP